MPSTIGRTRLSTIFDIKYLDFAVVNTWFKKEVRKMIMYETKACKTVIDFFLIRKSERKLVRDVKVVHEECIKQHKLLICVLDLKEKLVRSKVKFRKRCKVWKLKEAETEGIFRECRQESQCK